MGKLAEKSSFAEFNPLGGIKPNAKKIEEVCSTAGLEDSLKNAWPTMKTEAPQLVTFFSQMLQNRRKNHQSIESITADDEQSGPIYLLAALVLRGYSRNKSSFLREVLGLYIMANGTPRRVIDTVAHLGVVSSYTKLNDLLNVMQDKAKEHIKQVAHDPTGVIVYDNFNFLNRIRELAGGRQNEFVSLTMACLVSCPELNGPLLQKSFNLKQKSFNLKQKFTMDMVRQRMLPRAESLDIASRWLVKFCMAKLLAVEDKPVFPTVKQVKYRNSPYLQLGAIWEDEGTIQGVYNLHEEIWKRRLEFKDYSDRMTLVFGDQKTTSFIRRIQQDQLEASEQWEQKRWMLAIPAFFHIELNFMEMLFRNFWDTGDGGKTRSSATILSDVAFFRREKTINKKDMKYHQVMPLLIHGLTARIVAFVIAHLVDTGALDRHDLTVDGILEAMKAMDPERLEEVLDRVWDMIFTYEGWTGLYDRIEKDEDIDKEFRSHCRLMQCIEVLLLIHEAIRRGNYGLLEDLIPLLPFLFWGGKAANYGPEMAYFTWLLDPKVTTDKATQEAILKAGLVHCTTAGSGYKAIDMMIEHLNCAFAKDIKYNKNSTHDIQAIFSRLALNGNRLAIIRHALEKTFHSKQKGTHTAGDATADIISYAHKLYEDGLTVRGPNNGFDVPDIIARGQDILIDKLPAFNEVIPTPADAADQRLVPGVGDGGVVDGEIDFGDEAERLFNVGEEGDEFFDLGFELDNGFPPQASARARCLAGPPSGLLPAARFSAAAVALL